MLRTLPLVTTLAVLLIAVPAAEAASVSGRVSKPGYTVIAMGTNAKATSARTQSFRLKATTRVVTLHLRARDGSYAGPLVAGKPSKRSLRATRVVMGVKAGARLGTIVVRRGYATLARRLSSRYLDQSRLAKARKGVPIGAGNFGRVRSRTRGARAAQDADPSDVQGGADPDGDGLPNSFDADNDGDVILDNSDQPLDTGPPEPGSRGPGCDTPPRPQNDVSCITQTGFWTFSQLLLGPSRTLNANAGVTRAQIDAVMSGADSGSGPDYNPGVSLIMQVPSADSVELDCGGLTYCSKGGTGQVEVFSGPQRGSHPFPGDFDADNDGFGDMIAASRQGPGGPEFTLLPHAASAQIGPGDTFIERVVSGGVETQVPGSIVYVFNTTPAVIAYTDGQNPGTIGYPTGANPPGSERNPIMVEPNAQGEIVFTMTIWRPQRTAFPNESGEFIDLGHLGYPISSPSLPFKGQGGGGGGSDRLGSCRRDTYSTSDPNLKVPTDDQLAGPVDQSGDAPPSPGRTLTFSINLTQCLDGRNEENVKATWDKGETFDLTLQAKTPVGDNGGQRLFLQRK